MTNMKKITAFILLVTLVFSLFGCGEEHFAVNRPDDGVQAPAGSVEQPKLDDDPTNDFTVRLTLDGEEYIPNVAVTVYWSDGYNIHVAPMADGIARIDGLDGDYTVTLYGTPSGYTYDPNAYMATNDDRNIIIEMKTSGAVLADGNGLWNAEQVTTTGVYTVTIYDDPTDKNGDGRNADVIYFDFIPQTNGTYTIESWVSTSDDEINPICLAYANSSIAYKGGEYKVTDVGACGSYTRNFIYTVQIANENISMNGSQCFTFAITAETKSGVYPATFSFAIKRDGDFDYDRADKTMIIPKFDWSNFDFEAFNALAGTEKTGAAKPYGDNALIFAERDYMAEEEYEAEHKVSKEIYNYKVWEVSEGGDGVYHVFDEVEYASTGGYGPVLFAYIDASSYYMPTVLTHVEDAGNNALTVSSGTENYRQFIKGFEWVASSGFYCNFDCPCHEDGTPLACLEGCENCNSQCKPCPEELFNMIGYAQRCNTDGVAPVTPELKDFLQKFSISGGYFADGEGYVDERPGENGESNVYAYEDSQWLFLCGYYTGNPAASD